MITAIKEFRELWATIRKGMKAKKDFRALLKCNADNHFDTGFKEAFKRTMRRFIIHRVETGGYDKSFEELWTLFRTVKAEDDVLFNIQISMKGNDGVFMPMLYEEAQKNGNNGAG